jgi:hypothetical protein
MEFHNQNRESFPCFIVERLIALGEGHVTWPQRDQSLQYEGLYRFIKSVIGKHVREIRKITWKLPVSSGKFIGGVGAEYEKRRTNGAIRSSF